MGRKYTINYEADTTSQAVHKIDNELDNIYYELSTVATLNASTVPPQSPILYQSWYNVNNNRLYFFVDGKWKPSPNVLPIIKDDVFGNSNIEYDDNAKGIKLTLRLKMGHGSGLDADTLDGYHWSDIKSYVDNNFLKINDNRNITLTDEHNEQSTFFGGGIKHTHGYRKFDIYSPNGVALVSDDFSKLYVATFDGTYYDFKRILHEDDKTELKNQINDVNTQLNDTKNKLNYITLNLPIVSLDGIIISNRTIDSIANTPIYEKYMWFRLDKNIRLIDFVVNVYDLLQPVSVKWNYGNPMIDEFRWQIFLFGGQTYRVYYGRDGKYYIKLTFRTINETIPPPMIITNYPYFEVLSNSPSMDDLTYISKYDCMYEAKDLWTIGKRVNQHERLDSITELISYLFRYDSNYRVDVTNKLIVKGKHNITKKSNNAHEKWGLYTHWIYDTAAHIWKLTTTQFGKYVDVHYKIDLTDYFINNKFVNMGIKDIESGDGVLSYANVIVPYDSYNNDVAYDLSKMVLRNYIRDSDGNYYKSYINEYIFTAEIEKIRDFDI